MDVRGTDGVAMRTRVKTGPLPRLRSSALDGARTLEARALPGLFLLAFSSLIAVQLWLAFG